MPSITSLGIGSGLDISSIVGQLVEAETAPVSNRLARQEVDAKAKLSAFGSLKSALSEFQGLLSNLKEPSTFHARSATSSNSDVLTASASSSASTGQFDVEVVRVAEAHKLISDGFSAADEAVGTGTLTISVGGESFDASIDDSSKTLAGIRDAINNAADNTGVSATLINVDDGIGGTTSKLVLAARETGTTNQIAVLVHDLDLDNEDHSGLSKLAYDPLTGGPTNLGELQAALDAQIRIDNQLVTGSSNSLSDVIVGVTLNLASAAPGETVDLRISIEKDGASNAINYFVNGFNGVIDVLNQVASFDTETGQAATLFGEAAVRDLGFRLRRELGTQILGVQSHFRTLAEVGITTSESGKLTVNTATLDAALENNLEAVSRLFIAGDGYANRFDTLISGFAGPEGMIAARTDGLHGRIDDISNRRDSLGRTTEVLEQRYLNQFAAMDALVSQLQATSKFLSQQLSVMESLAIRGSSRGNI